MKKVTKLITFLIGIILLSSVTVNAQIELERTKEVITERDAFTKHFENEDGTITAVSYVEPIHYQDERGSWKDINNQLIDEVKYNTYSLTRNETSKDLFYTIKDNPYINVSFNKLASSAKIMKIEIDGYKLSWGLENINVSSASKFENSSENQYNLTNLTSGVKYENAFDKTDLYYMIESTNVKEELYIKEKTDMKDLIYNIETTLNAKKTEHGLVIFQNDKEENIVFFQSPYLYDSAEKSSMNFNTEVKLEKTANGYRIFYHFDEKWLNDEKRVYPIIIDPTVSNGRAQTSVLDTYVHPGDSVSHNHVNEDRLWVGKVNTKSRAFMNWNALPTINGFIKSAHISFNFFKGTSTWGPLSVFRVNSSWNSNNLTWNIHENLDYTELKSNLYPTLTNGYQNFSVNVTNTLRGWYNNSVGKNGFMVRYTNENYNDYNTILSSDSGVNSDFWPCLWINYDNNKPKSYTPSYYSDFLDNIAITAGNNLSFWGYQNTFMRNPSADDIANNITSPISILSGHGDTGHLYLGDRVLVTGSNNAWVESTTTEHTTPKMRYQMGIGQWDLSTVDLMVCAGCATAFNNGAVDPISQQAVKFGVRTSIGWKQVVGSAALETFVEKFLIGLHRGFNISDAISEAKKFPIGDSRVYDVAIYGLSTAKVTLPSNIINLLINYPYTEDNLIEYDINYLKQFDTLKKEDIINFIKENINNKFQINDYEIEEIDNVIRLIYAPFKIKTNNVYTVVFKNNKIESLSGYFEEDFDIIENKLKNSTKLTNEKENELRKKVIKESNLKVKIIKEGYQYSDNQLKFYILYDINNGINTSSKIFEYLM